MNWKGKVWFNEERDQIIKQLTRPGGIYAVQGGKVRLKDPNHLAYDIHWAFSGKPSALSCEFRNHVYWQRFHLIPAHCRLNCHKVVLSMTNVADLIRCLTMMEQMCAVHGTHGKCGLDIRWYTSGLYKAFWYTQSLEEGRECYEIAKEAVQNSLPKHILTNDSLILKKGCTEMEHPHFGGRPSSQWGMPTVEDIQLEEELESIFGRSDIFDIQPAWLHNRIIYEWIKVANTAGDKSYTVFVEDITNYVPDTYHIEGGDVEFTIVPEVPTAVEEGPIQT